MIMKVRKARQTLIHTGCLKGAVCNEPKDLTAEGTRQLNEILDLKRFLLDFSLIQEWGVRETVIWQDYMIYALLLGIADKVLPQIQHFERYMRYAGSYNAILYKAYREEQYRYQAFRNLGSGGHASFGGGGGFSGGGGAAPGKKIRKYKDIGGIFMKKLCKMWHSAGKCLLVFMVSLCVAVALQPATVQAADITKYDIWVGGEQVTSANAGSVTGVNITGAVSYNPGTNTLTLDNASITATTVSGAFYPNDTMGIYVKGSISNLTIELKGNNTITGTTAVESSYGIRADGNLTFNGNGSLYASAVDCNMSGNTWSVGIYAYDGITVSNGCTIEASCGTAAVVATPMYPCLFVNGTIVSAARDKAGNNVANPGMTYAELESYSYMKLEPGVQTPSANTDVYGISLSTDHALFGPTVGYSSLPAETVTVTNIGNAATGDLSVELVGSHADRFTLSTNSIASIAVGGSDSFSITPKDGSDVGEYGDVTVNIRNTTNNIFEHVSVCLAVWPPRPVVTGTLTDAVYVKGETAEPLVVSATVEGNGTLSYSWVIDRDGETFYRISGATEPSFVPPTDTVGTVTYYCIVTNTVNGFRIIEASEYATITVTEGGDNTLSGENVSNTPAVSDTASDNGSSTPAYVTYTVQRGDTLSAIAKRYGCSVSDIMVANKNLIKKPNLIYAGWQLNIPQNGTKGVSGSTSDAILPDDKKTTVYTVKQGDSLWLIARKHGCSMAEIVALNSGLIRNPKLIYAGWELKIPQN